MNIWDCPNGRDFVEWIIEKANSEKTHLFINCPGCHCESLFSMLGKQLAKIYGQCLRLLRPCSVLDAMEGLFNNESNLQAVVGCSFDWSIGLLGLPQHTQNVNEWNEFFYNLAQLTKQRLDDVDYLNWILIGIAPAGIYSPKEEFCLYIYDNPSIFGNSDIEYALEKNMALNRQQGCQMSLSEKLWAYALCKGLAVIDPGICDYLLAHEIPKTREEIKEALLAHPWAHLDSDTVKVIINYDSDPGLERFQHAYRQLKKVGLIGVDLYGNAVIHPAALLAANRIHSFEKYLSRGQIQVYLPLTQEAHKIIWRYLEHKHISDWKKQGLEAENIESDLLCLVKYMFKNLKGHYTYKLSEFSETWRNVRNIIAHGDFLEYKDAFKAINMLQEYHKPL